MDRQGYIYQRGTTLSPWLPVCYSAPIFCTSISVVTIVPTPEDIKPFSSAPCLPQVNYLHLHPIVLFFAIVPDCTGEKLSTVGQWLQPNTLNSSSSTHEHKHKLGWHSIKKPQCHCKLSLINCFMNLISYDMWSVDMKTLSCTDNGENVTVMTFLFQHLWQLYQDLELNENRISVI